VSDHQILHAAVKAVAAVFALNQRTLAFEAVADAVCNTRIIAIGVGFGLRATQ
jgi:CO dehydrogenase/acetyl-CoA synthase alpha subunit